ncbi:hypothetical protein BSQ98_25105 [Serratia liquefaciens]|uniref:DUF6932 family protein n=1 Tax=Serratia liquefaciens TaxID=614 RepID=UPI00102010DD|nr:hypothetical protein [Serratia liquefaciens]RYM58083.1 hypothetical protein BSQ98_25105 [Serratia liquefaciens]
MEKLCFPPLLSPGFHDYDDAGLKELCVDQFATSERRGLLYCNYIQFSSQIRSINAQFKCFSELWVDGSFTTGKPEPDDIDVLVVVDFVALNQLPEQFHGLVSSLLDRQYVKLNFNIDVLILPENHPEIDYSERRSYWRGWFGFDRKENPKGLVRVML